VSVDCRVGSKDRGEQKVSDRFLNHIEVIHERGPELPADRNWRRSFVDNHRSLVRVRMSSRPMSKVKSEQKYKTGVKSRVGQKWQR
jgi:hypothetical protein